MDWKLSKVTLGSLAAIKGLVLKIVEQNDSYAVTVRNDILHKGRTVDLPAKIYFGDVEHGYPAINAAAIAYASLVYMVKQIRLHVDNDLALAIMADVARDQVCVSLRGDMTVTLPVPLSSVWQAVLDQQRDKPVALFVDLASQLIADYARQCHFRWRGLGEEDDQGALRDVLQSSVKLLRIGIATDPDGVIISATDGDGVSVQHRLDRVALFSREDVYWAGVVERLILAYGKTKYWRN